MKPRKLLLSGPYLRAILWIQPIVEKPMQIVAAVDGQYIWRDKELSRTVPVTEVLKCQAG